MPKTQAKKERIDIVLVQKGLASSRNLAQSLILSGQVLVNEISVTKAGTLIFEDEKIRIKNMPKYVSRGGDKLEKALNAFDITPLGWVCADIGSSTGGFTDCLLQKGAKKVYAIDCGTNQLDYRLRSNEKVVVYEETNVKDLAKEHFDEAVQLIVIDLSFISVKKILPHVISNTRVEDFLIILIKPQFEGERDDVEKGGIVRSKEAHEKIIRNFFTYLENENLSCCGFTHSPITGRKGNIEYLLCIDVKKERSTVSFDKAKQSVDEAFSLFREELPHT